MRSVSKGEKMSGFDGMKLGLAEEILRREGFWLVYAGPRISRYRNVRGEYRFHVRGDMGMTIKRAEYTSSVSES